MFNSFESVHSMLAGLPGIEAALPDAARYRAHRPHNPASTQEPEPFPEHVELVNVYFGRLVGTHGLDHVIDTLINDLLPTADEQVGRFVKQLFVSTAPYHDYGKVNENFQAHPDKMNNPAFTQTPDLSIGTTHAKLGAYLYLYKHFQDFMRLRLTDPALQRRVGYILLMLSYPIIRHHGGRLKQVGQEALRFTTDELACMSRYIKTYQYEFIPGLATQLLLPENLHEKFFRFSNKSGEGLAFGFPLFALLRLNFSLLTAADYLATSEYMNQAGVDDLGVLTDAVRQTILDATRTSKSYNAEAFRLADQPDWKPVLPLERNNDALNRLRLTMAVEVIRAVRAQADKRLFYLEAPTGGGKTNLSMLAAAELLHLNPELNKVFYVFPFTTLITQTHRAILDTWQLDESQVGLLHSKSGFQQKEEPGEGKYGQAWRNQLHNQFAHFPVCLLTHIRFFDMLKSERKDDIYLMHRLANSVVIIDELQSYPPQHWDKMLFWIDQYTRYFNIRFVLMSATLPRIDTLSLPLANRPDFCDLLPNAKAYFINPNFRDRVRFRFDLLENTGKTTTPRTVNLDEVAQAVLTESERYAEAHDGRVFTMVEFIYKKSATEFAVQMDGQFFDEVLVLSGTILESRRREVINRLKRSGRERLKLLLVTTQVVEAGVDIDMDLGFKNVSLIDNDEQLAGRINRNVTKDVCEVFLFRLNEPGILYKHDERFRITRDNLTLADHKAILQTKDFGKLYKLVIAYLDKLNSTEQIDNFTGKYLPTVQTLNYPEASNQFKLIDTHNLSVFVPMSLPVRIKGPEADKPDAIFLPIELAFLAENKVHEIGDETVNGEAVWLLYRSLEKLNASFAEKQINKKIMQGILAKFTFSVFYTDTIRRELCPRFTGPEEDSFPEYLYLRHYDEVYTYKTGLDQSRFESSENSIL